MSRGTTGGSSGKMFTTGGGDGGSSGRVSSLARYQQTSSPMSSVSALRGGGGGGGGGGGHDPDFESSADGALGERPARNSTFARTSLMQTERVSPLLMDSTAQRDAFHASQFGPSGSATPGPTGPEGSAVAPPATCASSPESHPRDAEGSTNKGPSGVTGPSPLPLETVDTAPSIVNPPSAAPDQGGPVDRRPAVRQGSAGSGTTGSGVMHRLSSWNLRSRGDLESPHQRPTNVAVASENLTPLSKCGPLPGPEMPPAGREKRSWMVRGVDAS